MLTQHDRNIAYERNICHHATDNIFALQVILSSGVELRIVCGVVVAFREELCFFSVYRLANFPSAIPSANPSSSSRATEKKGGNPPNSKLPNNPMHNRDILPLNIIHHNLPHRRLAQQIPIPEKQEVAALEGGFHGAGENDDDG